MMVPASTVLGDAAAWWGCAGLNPTNGVLQWLVESVIVGPPWTSPSASVDVIAMQLTSHARDILGMRQSKPIDANRSSAGPCHSDMRFRLFSCRETGRPRV